MTEIQTAVDRPSPIIIGASKKSAHTKSGKANGAAKTAKGKTAKAPAKKAPAKKAKAEGEGRSTSIDRSSTIKHSATFKDWKILKNDSVGAKRAKLIKDGVTVADYLASLSKNGLPPGLGTLQAAVKGEYVTIKK